MAFCFDCGEKNQLCGCRRSRSRDKESIDINDVIEKAVKKSASEFTQKSVKLHDEQQTLLLTGSQSSSNSVSWLLRET